MSIEIPPETIKFCSAELNCQMLIDSGAIQTFNEADPTQLPWKELDIDLVMECNGSFNEREMAEKHIQSGTKTCSSHSPHQMALTQQRFMGSTT